MQSREIVQTTCLWPVVAEPLLSDRPEGVDQAPTVPRDSVPSICSAPRLLPPAVREYFLPSCGHTSSPCLQLPSPFSALTFVRVKCTGFYVTHNPLHVAKHSSRPPSHWLISKRRIAVTMPEQAVSPWV